MVSKRLTLAEQIAALDNTLPDFDSEIIHGGDSDSDQPSLNREHYVDLGPSSRQKMQDISISDEKYEGSKVSRRQLEDETDEDISGPSESEEDKPVNGLHNEPEDSPEEEEELTHVAPQADELTAVLHKKREEDRMKGAAVSAQLTLWNNLMDARIRSQKLSTATTELPEAALLTSLVQDSECQASLKRMLDEALVLSDEIFELREALLPDEVQAPPRKKRKLETDDLLEYGMQLQEVSSAHATFENTYHPHLLETLSKWSSKIQAVAPSALLPSNRNAFSKTAATVNSNVVDQINDVVTSDYSKLISRTRIRRSKGRRLGVDPDGGETGEAEDVELFDDTDFYQQMLRDVIDATGEGDQNWVAIQKQRKAHKKKVDTRASKGRKIRYDTHEKLQNFMVPIPAHSGWHEEQVDELFVSLLGREIEPSVDVPEAAGAMNGFRVFG